ncbi:hypothetical protein N4R57_18210 [Rhodobacteraceae bacterium D3-12]|nr:hypothetical protein N4R57_18210 [Rhodobacteraceae bacterium D3-12]
MSIAVVTMVWNDNWFLRRWMSYYAPLVGERNLYVVSHGRDDSLREIVGNANLIEMPRDPNDLNFDTRRWGFLSSYTSALTRYHDAVICLDVDELLIPVNEGDSLVSVIERFDCDAPRAVPGFELFPQKSDAANVDRAERIAPLMAGAMFNPFYSKSGIAMRPVEFFPGAHGMMDEPAKYCGDLALLHLRFANLEELRRRNAARMDISDGAIPDEQSFREEGKPFATWRKADKVTRQAFRGFRLAREVEWGEMLSTVAVELERLRVRRGRVHKFLTKRYEPLRASLPPWFADQF